MAFSHFFKGNFKSFIVKNPDSSFRQTKLRILTLTFLSLLSWEKYLISLGLSIIMYVREITEESIHHKLDKRIKWNNEYKVPDITHSRWLLNTKHFINIFSLTVETGQKMSTIVLYETLFVSPNLAVYHFNILKQIWNKSEGHKINWLLLIYGRYYFLKWLISPIIRYYMPFFNHKKGTTNSHFQLLSRKVVVDF